MHDGLSSKVAKTNRHCDTPRHANDWCDAGAIKRPSKAALDLFASHSVGSALLTLQSLIGKVGIAKGSNEAPGGRCRLGR